MNISLEKIKEFDLKKSTLNFFLFFYVKRRWIFFLVMLALVAYCAYVWYFFVEKYSWSEAKKAEYLLNNRSEVIFEQSKFENISAEAGKRKERRERNIEIPRDIFK